MRARSFGSAFFAGLLFFIALSTGERLYLLLALVLLAMLVLSLVTSLWALFTLHLDFSLSTEGLTRGMNMTMKLRAGHGCPLPIAPVKLAILAPEGEEILRVPVPALRPKTTLLNIFCPHVGCFEVGIRSVAVEDVFGLFSFRAKRFARLEPVMVHPRPEPIPPLKFSPGEHESEVISRATEDASSPSGVRSYQEGDVLKKVHWKLSMRKREILIKTYDQPLRPDALVLMDCMPPKEGDYRLDVQDRLCDMAASVGAMLLEAEALLRMPLTGNPPEEVSFSQGGILTPLFDSLSRMGFSGTTRLEQVLQIECRRMRRSGATVVLLSALTPVTTDLILRLSRMGPFVRVYFITDTLEEGEQLLVQRLIRNNVECVVEQLQSAD